MRFDHDHTGRVLNRVIGWPIFVVSGASLFGYVFGVRWALEPLYGDHPMAFTASVCFFLLATRMLYENSKLKRSPL